MAYVRRQVINYHSCMQCGALVDVEDFTKHGQSHAELKQVLQMWADMLEKAQEAKPKRRRTGIVSAPRFDDSDPDSEAMLP